MSEGEGATYQKSGVDIEAGARAVGLMGGAVRSTKRPEVLGRIGGFGGLFALDKSRYKEPVLVSGADGVGTKLKLAQMMDLHGSVGIDLVAMCADDVVALGAEPLFLLDYIAIGKLVPEKVATIVTGIAEGCKMAGCALLGGETAEHPGVMDEGDYDLAGFCVGIVEKEKIIDGSKIEPGDKILGLASSGLHSNGYSLVRSIFFKEGYQRLGENLPKLGKTLGQELLTPTRIYARSILKILGEFDLKGISHITGGGITENLPRIIPEGLGAKIDKSSWSVPRVFELIRFEGGVTEPEMFKAFNMGIGMAVVVSKEVAPSVKRAFEETGETVFEIGEVARGAEGVEYV
ncbi:MAG: phosphoribosylformylglycinamidine cyclo-ligase [Actinomycetota bacterium]|nr:phosphoribosylformylglycinamidine cyclo-ligase [Actinomycetota bacterium]